MRNPHLEFREEKCWDLFSGSRREREFLQKNREICDHFSNVEKRRIFFLFDKKVKFTYHQSQSPFWVLTSKSRIKIVCWKIPSQKRNDHLSGSTMIIHYIVFPLCNLSKYSHRRLLLEVSTKCFCLYCWSKSTKIANLDFSRELEEKLRGKIERRKWTFLSQNFESWEENMFAKSHSFEKRNFSSKSRIPRGEREFFLQNLDNQEHLKKWTFNSPAPDKKKWAISSRDRESCQCLPGSHS